MNKVSEISLLWATATVVLLWPLQARPANVSLTNSDAYGATSFNAKGNWNSSSAPSSGNSYSIGGFDLRTPANNNNFTFAGSSLTVGPGGRLIWKGAGVITINNLILAGGGLGNGNNANITHAGYVSIVTDSFTTLAQPGSTTVISASITNGTGSLTITNGNNTDPGNGNLTLNGNNTGWTGRLIVSQGSQTNMPRLNIDSEVRLGGNPAVFTPDQLTLTNTILSCAAGFTIDDANRGITIAGTNAAIDTIANAVTVAVPITGPASLTKLGTGPLVLSGSNSYSGNSVVSAGLLRLGKASALPYGAGKGLLQLDSAGTLDLSAINVTVNSLTGSGTVQTTNGVRSLFVGGSDQSSLFNGAIVGSAAGARPVVAKNGNGTVELAGTNDNSWAAAIVNSGTLLLGKTVNPVARAVGYGSPAALVINSGGTARISGDNGDQIFDGSDVALYGGGFDLNGRSEAVRSLFGTSGVVSNGAAATASTLTIGTSNGSGTYDGTLQDGAGTVALTKTGTGTATLTGANTYSGGTVINGGTLAVNGSTVGGCLVSAGAILAGTGNVAGAVSVSGSIQPGNPALIGTAQLDVGQLTLNAGATAGFHLSGITNVGPPFNDLLNVNGNLTLSGNTVSITLLGANLAPGTYRLINYTGAKTGAFGSVTHNTRYTLTLDVSVTNQINLVVSGAGGADLRWTGANSAIWSVGATANWLNTATATPDVFRHLDRVLFDDRAGVPTNATLASAMYPGAVTVNADTNNFAFIGSGRISGGGGLTKLGASTLTISNANDFTGPVVIKAGTVRVGNGSALGASSAGVTIENGGALDVNGISLGAEPVFVSGSGPSGGGALVDARIAGQRNLNVMRYVTLLGDTAAGGDSRWDIRNGSFTGQGYSLTKVGTAGLGLASVGETGLGDIFVKEGWLGFEYDATLGDPTKQLLLWTNTGLWFHSSSPLMTKHLSMTNATLWADSGVNILPGPINMTGECVVDGSDVFGDSTLELRGPVSGLGMLTKTGPCTLVLSASNTYSGGTLISEGTLQLGNGGTDGDLGTGNLTLTNNGTLTFNRSDDFTWNRDVSGTNGQFIKRSTNTLTLTATNAYLRTGQGALQVNGGTLLIASNGLLIVNGEINVAVNVSTGRCIINGGTVICSNWIAVGINNSNSVGELVVNSGSLHKRGVGDIVMGGFYSAPNLAAKGTLTVNGGVVYNNGRITLGETTAGRGYLNLNGGLVQATRIYKAALAERAESRFNGGQMQAVTNAADFIAVDLALVQSGGLVLDDAGFALTNNQPMLADTNSPGGGLTKLGTGSLTLTAGNTYTGPTLLTAGSLAVTANGSVASSSLISLAPATTLNATGLVSGTLTIPASQTLAGYGTVLGNLWVNGTLIPGDTNALGVLTASNNITLAGNTMMEIARVPGMLTNDLLRGVATLACGGSLTVTTTNSSADFTDGDTFKLFAATNYTGSFTNFVLPDFSPCLTWDTSKLAVNGTLKLVAAASRPKITQQPAGRAALFGGTITLQVKSTGGSTTNYQWLFNGMAMPGKTNNSVTLTNLQATNLGAYSVVVSSSTCQTLSQSALVTFAVPPTVDPPVWVDPVMILRFTTEGGPSYVAEYTDTLAPPDWTTFATRSGTGGIISVVDSEPASERRFYRIRVQ